MKALVKRYETHQGLDLKTSDLTRGPSFASGMRNAQYRHSGAPEKRKGYHGNAGTFGGYGQWTYQRANPTTGADESEIVGLDQNLFRVRKATIAITYAGAETNCKLSILFDVTTAQYRCQIEEGTATVLDFALGLGFDEASPITLAQLETAIDALAGFTAVISGTSSTPAAFLQSVRAWDLVGSGAYTGTARYPEQVNTTVSNPLAAFYAKRNNTDFENASAVNIANCLYVGTGFDHTMKYDGQTFCRAGIPAPSSVASALNGAGAVTGSNYEHRAQCVQFDAAGNIVEGNLTAVPARLNPAAQQMAVTVANVLAGSGYNTNCAIVVGAQVGVNTITVDDGSGGTHTMKSGDTAYFYDAISAAYVTRAVTAVAAGSITVAGAAVTVADNAVVSNNLRIAIFRNQTSATTPQVFYLVAEVPNNSFAATQVVADNLPDASLGALLTPPATDRSPPPKGKYVSQWNGAMIVMGDPANPTTLYSSDSDGPEYFPADSNQWLIEAQSGDKLAGGAQNGDVFVCMGGDTFAVLSGDILTASIRVDVRAKDVGCVSHASITEVNGGLVWLSKKGPRYSIGGQIPQPLGQAVDDGGKPLPTSRIDSVFSNEGKLEDERFQVKRAVGINDKLSQKYLLYVPAESTTSGSRHSNSSSRIYAYDYTRDAWLEWTNMDLAGGAAILGDEFFFQERRYSSFALAVVSIMYRRHGLDDALDYADHNKAMGVRLSLGSARGSGHGEGASSDEALLLGGHSERRLRSRSPSGVRFPEGRGSGYLLA